MIDYLDIVVIASIGRWLVIYLDTNSTGQVLVIMIKKGPGLEKPMHSNGWGYFSVYGSL